MQDVTSLPEGLLEPSIARRHQEACREHDPGRRVFLGALEPGTACVVEAEVRARGPNRDFTRRDGQKGALCRLVLADVTGTADLVLWNEERALAEGPLAVGNHVRLCGPTVRAAYARSDGAGAQVELHLGQARVDVVQAPETMADVTGELLERTPWDRPDGRTGIDVRLRTEDGDVTVALEGAAARAVRQRLGGRVRVRGLRPHALLPDCYHGDGATQVLPD